MRERELSSAICALHKKRGVEKEKKKNAMADASTSSSSFSSRLSALASSASAFSTALPPVTLALTVALALAHLLRLALGLGVLAWCLDVRLVIKKLQLWRLATAPLAHVGVVHLLFNAWAIVPAASERELEAGAHVLLLELAFLVLASGLAFVFGGEVIHDLSDEIGFLKKTIGEVPRPACAAGASGVALGLLSAAAGSPGAPARFDLAGFSLPGRLRPWLLALAIQILVPEVSLAGHLSGLACGEVLGAVRRRRNGGGAAGQASWVARARASLLPVTSSSSGGENEGLGARFAALFKGLARGRRGGGGGWQSLPGDEAAPPRGRTTGTAAGAGAAPAAVTTTMTAAEAARAAAEARAAAAAAPTR